MKLLIAKNLGFCTGVNRAYRLAIQAAKKGGPVYILGYLVHNQKVIDELKEKGIQTVSDLREIPKGASGSLIISAHGLPPEDYEKAKSTGLSIIDTTCPWVKRPQALAKKLSDEGYHIVIVGDKNHTEVAGILGWAGKRASVVDSVKEARKLTPKEKIAAIAQTTQSSKHFDEIVNALAERTKELQACNTICEATKKMQRSAVDVSRRAEIMLVIGDGKSANTRRLKELCEETGAKTYQIEGADSLDMNLLKGFDIIGLTAGASTPAYVIEDVIKKLRGN